MTRWLLFIIALVLGAAAGLYYGWVVNPVKYVDTTPASLSADYQTDYVLMVAEAYQAEGDLELAVRRLALLGDTPPLESARAALVYASKADPPYAEADLDRLSHLASALRSWNPVQGAQEP